MRTLTISLVPHPTARTSTQYRSLLPGLRFDWPPLPLLEILSECLHNPGSRGAVKRGGGLATAVSGKVGDWLHQLLPEFLIAGPVS
jgi:hypothetical protein